MMYEPGEVTIDDTGIHITLPTPIGEHDCPCCGNATYSSDLLCSECQEADCQQTTDACGETGYSNCQMPPVVTYETIVFIQGDESDEPLSLLYNRYPNETWHYMGATAESIACTFAYMAQWDYGEPSEECDCPSAGIGDRWVSDDGQYILTANLGMGHIGLCRVITST